MRLYAGIDLHANNSYLAAINETDELVEAKRLPNDIESVRRVLEPYRENLAGTSSLGTAIGFAERIDAAHKAAQSPKETTERPPCSIGLTSTG